MGVMARALMRVVAAATPRACALGRCSPSLLLLAPSGLSLSASLLSTMQRKSPGCRGVAQGSGGGLSRVGERRAGNVQPCPSTLLPLPGAAWRGAGWLSVDRLRALRAVSGARGTRGARRSRVHVHDPVEEVVEDLIHTLGRRRRRRRPPAESEVERANATETEAAAVSVARSGG